ncbi:hypothetical protein [Actinomadura nitritigenes]|uniref:hypothetical protein n=1 Tax=Actinomadura nitritigenes TaxID=134602 RepID=UPI003D930364
MDLNNGAEGGPLGATVSTANSGGASGNPFDLFAGTPTITYDNTHALGTQSYKVVAGASAQQMAWSSASVGTVAEMWWRIYLWSSAAPSGVTGIIRWTIGGSQAARLRYETDGTLTLSDSGNAAEIATASAFPTGEWARIEGHIQFVATGAAVELRTYHGDSATPIEAVTGSAGGIGVNCDQISFGSFNAATWTGWMDGINANDNGFKGPLTRGRSGLLVPNYAARRAASW